MADKKISELTELTTPDGTEELVVNDSGVSKKVQIDNLIADNGLSGDKIDGGTISNFTSTGIDDNATSTAITIDASENVALTNGMTIGGFGTIGIQSTNNLTIGGSVADHAGIQFGTEAILPQIATVNANGTVDLGGGTVRFRDVYASSIKFNGDTAAANALDDYEEGTWTPVVKVGTTTNTGTLISAVYTKIGRQVTVYCSISSITLSGTGNLTIEGLPFVCGINHGMPGASRYDNINTGGVMVTLTNSGTSIISCQNYDSTSGWTGSTNNAHLGATYHLYNVSMTYFV